MVLQCLYIDTPDHLGASPAAGPAAAGRPDLHQEALRPMTGVLHHPRTLLRHLRRTVTASVFARRRQYITLKLLSSGSAGVTDLARHAELNPGAMTRLLDKLEERGLLARESVPGDRRALQIMLTEAGQAMWLDVNQCGQRVRERAMDGMDDAQRELLMRMLEQVRDNLSLSDT